MGLEPFDQLRERYNVFHQFLTHSPDDRPSWDVFLADMQDNPLLMMLERDTGTIDRTFKSRVSTFCDFQRKTGGVWFDPQLTVYRDYMLEIERKSINTVGSYLSTLRGAYRKLAGDGWFRTLLYSILPDTYQEDDKQRYIEEFCEDLEVKVAVFKTPVIYPPRDSLRDLLKDSLYLTPSEINQLLSAPVLGSLKGVRDRAIIATLLCTGIWAHELVNLDAQDVLRTALQIRDGNEINRVIRYGKLKWGLVLLKTWMRRAGIGSGPVFVSIGRNDQINLDSAGNPKRLSSTAISLLLRGYPIWIDGQRVTVKPRQLRYMYGHILYSLGLSDRMIQRNLGYEDDEGIQCLLRSRLLPKQAILRKQSRS